MWESYECVKYSIAIVGDRDAIEIQIGPEAGQYFHVRPPIGFICMGYKKHATKISTRSSNLIRCVPL